MDPAFVYTRFTIYVSCGNIRGILRLSSKIGGEKKWLPCCNRWMSSRRYMTGKIVSEDPFRRFSGTGLPTGIRQDGQGADPVNDDQRWTINMKQDVRFPIPMDGVGRLSPADSILRVDWLLRFSKLRTRK